MNNLQRGIIDLVQAALTGEKVTLSTDFDWAVAGPIGVSHSILPMLYYGAQNGGVTLPEEVQKRLDDHSRAIKEKDDEIIRVAKMGREALEEAK